MKIAYTKADGQLFIVHGVAKSKIERDMGKELTDDEYRAIVNQAVPADAVDATELPNDWQPDPDRTFRDAWEIDGKGVKVRMDRARDIHREHLRAERQAELAKLDVEQLRAAGKGDKAEQDRVEAKKQKLRDAPAHPSIEAAATPDELKALTLAQLSG